MLGHFEINWYILDACAWGIFKNEVKLSGKNISLKSRNIRKSDAREMRKRQKRSKFHADHFQSGQFFPISNRKGAMTS